MIPVDFHSHSLFSGCGVHTVLEMLIAAKAKGIKGIAITDHGPLVGGRANSVFFERLHDPVPGIRLLKGMECNVDGDTGRIDCPAKFLGFMDIVIAGLHDNLPSGLPREQYTRMLIKAMEKNAFLDIVSHPNNNLFPVLYAPVVEAAVRLGIVLEMNNSKVLMRRVPDQETEELILLCKRLRCRVAVVSDAHVLTEVGRDEDIRPLLSKHQFPEELIVNRSVGAAFAFIEERRERKKLP
jgi:putative hydrolase